jgi:branched-chain amino acid transport system substrate-binding protein
MAIQSKILICALSTSLALASCSSVETRRAELPRKAPPIKSVPPPEEAPAVLSAPVPPEIQPEEIGIASGAGYQEDPFTIATILPLTGRNSALGYKILRSIQMGLNLGTDPQTRFKLVIHDSEGDPQIALQKFEEMIVEDKPMALVGPLLSKNAVAIAERAQAYRLPAVALSQKSGLTEIGPYIFRNAISSSMQVSALLDKAMGELGLKKFAIIYPNEAYGVEYANVFWDQVLERGGEVAAAQIYDPKQTDFKETIQRTVGQFYIEPRLAEYNQKMRELKLQQKNKPASRKNNIRQQEQEDILPPIVNFDAVFIPDSAKNLAQVVSFLAYARVKGVKVLGTNLLNTPGLARRLGNFSSEIIFVDIPGVASNFADDYSKTFGEAPGLLEVHAYESALLLRQLVIQGARSRSDLQRRLSQVERFNGVNSILNMSERRELSRKLQTFRLEKSDIVPF